MKSRNPLFAFIRPERVVAVVQAASKKQARERAFLIRHLCKIPPGCKVQPIQRGAICRAPVFFEGHFLALEDALSGA